MISWFFLIVAFIFGALFFHRLFKRNFLSAFGYLSGALVSLVLTVALSPVFLPALSAILFNESVFGNSHKGTDDYKEQLQKSCQGQILQQCSQASSDIEKIDKCMFNRIRELSIDCSLFLSNAVLLLPPLETDSVVTGVAFPKGTVVGKINGELILAIIPKRWEFVNKECGEGQVRFARSVSDRSQWIVSQCEKE